jgi:hypothetical protein
VFYLLGYLLHQQLKAAHDDQSNPTSTIFGKRTKINLNLFKAASLILMALLKSKPDGTYVLSITSLGFKALFPSHC